MDGRLRRGIRLFNSLRFFQCHEVLEDIWTSERGPRRLFLQALIHIAVGFYHCQRGNAVGARLQLRKGLRKLAGYLPSYDGVDAARLHREVLAIAERIEADAMVSKYPEIHISPSSRAGV